jgi:hypothetical protein
MFPVRLLLALPCLLAACTTTKPTPLEKAAAAPLADLNLVRTAIPAVLLEARDRPYRLPVKGRCADLEGELKALDEALGPDLDGAMPATAPGDRLGQAAGSAAVSALRRTTESVLPMRGWLRKLSGAERREQRVNAALAAGTARRAFIKGVLMAKGCITPAELAGATALSVASDSAGAGPAREGPAAVPGP